MRYNDPSGHCIAEGLSGWDTQENKQCYVSAHHIATLGGLEYIQGHFGGGAAWYKSVDQWLDTALSDPNLDDAYLRPHADPLYQSWCNNVGLVGQAGCGGSYVAHPVREYAAVNFPAPCDFWDCPAIGLDLASLGLSIAQTGAVACTATGVGAPVCGPAAGYLTAADITVNATSIGYESYKYTHDDGTAFDLSVTLADSAVKPVAEAVGAGASATPGVGVAYDLLMLGYDLVIDPFVTTFGSAKTAR